ncbi:MFS transporter [Paenibacillus sp. LHD-38]|uniref:MFS transporter n=1 Tax=Paenibacillus sp. LHD-38 TaxID=3072143 RepID=UPI00280E90C2|nr:MFS transporter [Paenibacillus sp. LHD-38]MDQ8736869.1 MFS transporter [Paenibacillus sp. LHD-38]
MERLWTKPFILMTMGNLFLFVAFYMLYPTLPPFIKGMGGSESQIGLVMGAFALSAVLFRPLVGGLLDRFGRRPFIVWGILLFTLAMYLYGWVGGIAVLIGLRILHGLSWAVSTTAMITSITDMIPSARRGEGMGWFSSSMTLAMAIGPLLGIWVAQDLSYSALFLFAVVLSVAALLLTFGSKMPFQPQTGARRIELYEKSVLPLAASVFFLFIAYGGITTFVPLLAGTIQVNSGIFFLTFAATLAFSRPISGKLSDRYGEMAIIVPSLVITICSLVVLSLSTGLIGVLISAVLYGIGFGSAQPAFQSAKILLARPDRKGVANATITTANDLGIGLGAIMLGWISQYTSYQVLFTVSAVSVAVSLVLFTFFVKRLLKDKEQSLNADSLPIESN